ncbi:DUF2264 domain-containing protein [Streptomyces sp. SID11233]|nr:DUF2264 domain-containing protein [Streptomyces sp. SID11233]
MLSLPPENRALSPRTGWTRAHWGATADGLPAAMEPYRSADGAQILLPGRHSSSGCDGLEGFARGLLLAAFRTAGGRQPGLLDPYTRGLAGPGLWPPIRDRFQPMVEAACIAIGLRLTREHVSDTLAADAQERLAAYLADALTHEPVDNSWWLFPAMVGDFLASVGIKSDSGRAAVERGLDRSRRTGPDGRARVGRARGRAFARHSRVCDHAGPGHFTTRTALMTVWSMLLPAAFSPWMRRETPAELLGALKRTLAACEVTWAVSLCQVAPPSYDTRTDASVSRDDDLSALRKATFRRCSAPALTVLSSLTPSRS